MDRRVFLKVKIKSLAEEARIIRAEAKKNDYMSWDLHQHRKLVVRTEARDTLLAYAFIRGRRYKQVERTCHEKPRAANIIRMVQNYSTEYPRTVWNRSDLEESERHVRKWLQE